MVSRRLACDAARYHRLRALAGEGALYAVDGECGVPPAVHECGRLALMQELVGDSGDTRLGLVRVRGGVRAGVRLRLRLIVSGQAQRSGSGLGLGLEG